MKKIVITLLLGLFLGGTWSCKQKTTDETTTNDSTAVITDSTKVDSVATAEEDDLELDSIVKSK